MKAMMKLAGAAKFFQRVEKKKQQVTDDDKMFQAEELVIAEEIGIDPAEIPNLRWFFDQTRLMKLPQHWSREFVNDNVVYVNDLTKEKQCMHPNVGLLKVFYYERIENDKAAATFTDKSRKLLPHIEQKLSKEMIGLSSKRKQAEKVNLKRDEQGKYVTSKTVRIAPDTTKLMASRNYLLKSIVDKVVTKQELWGYGKRARQYATILDKNKSSKVVPGFGEEQEEVETLDLMDRIYAEAFEFYEVEYRDLTGMPSKIDEKTFKLLTPETVVMCLQLLGIGKQQIQHYWLGQIMNCLILPPLWRRHKGSSFDEFVYQPKNITFDLHPSFIYMIEQRNRFIKRYPNMPIVQQQHYLSFRQMEFIDFFERTFVVDIYAYLEKFQAEVHKKNKSSRTQKHINDWLILQGLTAAETSQQNYLIGNNVEEFWKSKNFLEQIWAPSVSPYGEVLWNHNVTGSCREQCPYEAQLKRYLSPFVEKIGVIQAKDYKPFYEEFANIEQFDAVLESNLNEKMNFLRHYIEQHRNPYKISESYNAQTYLSSIFSCPFNFQSDLSQQQLPLWLQICRARKLRNIIHQILSKPVSNSTIQSIYNIVKKYYLEATLRRQPNNLQTVRSSLAQTVTRQQLLKFTDYVFDIGQRQERLRQQNRKVEAVEKKDQDDIFGSSQSQIDLNQYSTQEEPQEYSLLEPDKNILDNQELSDGEDLEEYQPTPEEEKEVIDESEGKIELTEKSSESSIAKPPTPLEQGQSSYQDETVLDAKIKNMKKKTLKVRKFSPHKQQPLEIIQKVNRLPSRQDRMRCKKNLILSNLKKQQLPDKQAIFNSPVKKSIVQSQTISNSELPTVNMFNSTLSNYSNDTVVSMINKLPKKSAPEPVIRPPSPVRLVKVTSVESKPQTEQSVLELMPIVKESIRDDPVLRHISRIPNIGEFCSTFRFSTADTTDDSEMFKSSAFTRTKRLEDPDRQQIKSCERLMRTPSILKSKEQSSPQKLRSPEKLRPSQTSTNFKRRCLSSTASHLLNSNAITSRLAFEKIEIRKQLYMQNRGMRDFLDH